MTNPIIRIAALSLTTVGVALAAAPANASELGVIQVAGGDCEVASFASGGLDISSVCTQAGGELQWSWDNPAGDTAFMVFTMIQDTGGGWALAPQDSVAGPVATTDAVEGSTYALYVVGVDSGLTSAGSTVVSYEPAPPPVEEEPPPVEEEEPPIVEEEPPVQEEEPPPIVEEEEPPVEEEEPPPVVEEEAPPVAEETPIEEEEPPVEEEEPSVEEEEPPVAENEPLTPSVQEQPFEADPDITRDAILERLMDLIGELEDDLEDRDATIDKLTQMVADLEDQLNRRN